MKLLPPPTQWTLERTSHIVEYELLNLSPASIYNISITSFSSDFGEGGSAWITAETDISVPDPPPPTPTILNNNEKTVTIEIPSNIVNNNGPINAIRVVVVIVDSELLQQFDEHLLKDYKHASEDGLNYYITAELENEVNHALFYAKKTKDTLGTRGLL